MNEPAFLYEQSARMYNKYRVTLQDPRPMAAILHRCEFQQMRAGEELCAEGSPGDAMFFLLSGACRVVRSDGDAAQREIALLESPAMLGHMSLIDGSLRSATCQISEPSLVAVLTRVRYEALLADAGQMGKSLRRLLLAGMVCQLSETNARIQEVLDFQREPTEEVLDEARATLRGWGEGPSREG